MQIPPMVLWSSELVHTLYVIRSESISVSRTPIQVYNYFKIHSENSFFFGRHIHDSEQIFFSWYHFPSPNNAQQKMYNRGFTIGDIQ